MAEMRKEQIVATAEERIALSGARIPERERDFLAEARWQSRRKSEGGFRPRAMTNGQRKAKHDLLVHLRQGLKDLTIVDVALDWKEAWWKKSDIKKALDKEALLNVVRIVVRNLGREYADPILAALGEAYRVGNEEIVIQRKVSRFG